MGKNAMVGVGILMVFLVAHTSAEEILKLKPTGKSVHKRSASRQSRSPRHYGNPNPFYPSESQYDNFFRQQPIPVPTRSGIYNVAQQSPAIGLSPLHPGYYSNVAAPASQSNPMTSQPTCGDRFDGVCQKSRYRTVDGSCNNPYEPTWGQANTRYARLLPSNYADGVHVPTRAKSGKPLPLSRQLSLVLFPDVQVVDKQFTLATMQWGQIVTHDMAMIDGTTQSTAHPTRCCSPDGQFLQDALSSPLCFPIVIPNDDPVHSATGTKCMNFVRSTTDLDRGCSSEYEPAEQLTVVTSYLDESVTYGSSRQTLASLRAGYGGRLVVDVRNGREYPPAAANKTASCPAQRQAEACYRAGDTRVNQNPGLTLFQIVLHREHNRIADELARINPYWSDEIIFQEARRISIAQHQHITYYEYLPAILGLDNLLCHKIIYDTKGYVDDYSPSINPSILNEHSTAAFRYFHSAIAGRLELVNEYRSYYSFNSLRLSDVLLRPGVIEQNDNLDTITRGLATQPELAVDQYLDSEITQFLFRGNNTFGADLKAIDIQRSRDHGLSSYNDYRQYCGLPRGKNWADFTDYISPENVEKLAQLYETPDDADLTVAGALERHVNGALAGPTFLCILLEQFYRTRAGDRFWFETSDPEVAFTPEQLGEIRKSSLSKLLCNNADDVKLMQARGFEILSENNPLRVCDELPGIDLSYWKGVQPRYLEEPNQYQSNYRL